MSEIEYGFTDNGRKVHIVDFDTNSMLALGNDDPDKARCGHTNDFTKVESPNLSQLCESCVDRYGIPDEFIQTAKEFRESD